MHWQLLLKDGSTFEGSAEDGSWKEIPDNIKSNVVGMKIYNQRGGATIDRNCDGYFFARKIRADIKTGNQQEFVGIGYWKKHERVARIKWYNFETMELLEVKTKPLHMCGFGLIRVGDPVK